MNPRQKFSIILLSLGLILAFLPLTSNRSLVLKPQKLMSGVLDESAFFTADQVARFVVSEDSTVQIIDLRNPEDYMSFNIPGSINIPYSKFLEKDPDYFLNNKNIRTIFYSNGDIDASYALTIARGLKYKNTYRMMGGLNEWFTTIMNSRFIGERISARENALFETRTRARKLFIEINSLPDSLKIKYMEARHLEAQKLDGGCE
jgi:rhodanese-related sulfurtransferase